MKREIDIGRGYVLSIDSRDIPLPVSLRSEVWDWCQQHGVSLEGHKYGVNGLDVWRIKDDQQRVRFLLRWL